MIGGYHRLSLNVASQPVDPLLTLLVNVIDDYPHEFSNAYGVIKIFDPPI